VKSRRRRSVCPGGGLFRAGQPAAPASRTTATGQWAGVVQQAAATPARQRRVAQHGRSLAGVGWIALAAADVARPRAAGLGVGAVLAIIGAQQPLAEPGAHGWAYALTTGVALVCFALSRWQREIVLLAAGVIGVAIAAPEAVWDWTDGAAGGAVILLVAGGALIAASAVGLGLWRARTPAGHPEHRRR
jgi:hypothetical protein